MWQHQTINDAENYDKENFKIVPWHIYTIKSILGKIAYNIELCQMISHTAEHYQNENSHHRKTWKLMMPKKRAGVWHENDTGWWDWTKIENGSKRCWMWASESLDHNPQFLYALFSLFNHFKPFEWCSAFSSMISVFLIRIGTALRSNPQRWVKFNS